MPFGPQVQIPQPGTRGRGKLPKRKLRRRQREQQRRLQAVLWQERARLQHSAGPQPLERDTEEVQEGPAGAVRTPSVSANQSLCFLFQMFCVLLRIVSI